MLAAAWVRLLAADLAKVGAACPARESALLQTHVHATLLLLIAGVDAMHGLRASQCHVTPQGSLAL